MASVLMLPMVPTPSPVSVRRGGRVVVLALRVTRILTSVRYLTLLALSSFHPDYYHLIPPSCSGTPWSAVSTPPAPSTAGAVPPATVVMGSTALI